MKALVIKAFAPTAHFSIPHLFSQRKTFPIPMYSTAIGIICNMLGSQERIDRFLSTSFEMAIVGKYESMEREYTWLRNISKKAHFDRFKSENIRSVVGEIEHPGGQLPAVFYTLNNFQFNIYINPSQEIMDMILDAFENPDPREIPHAGRAEDVIESLEAEIVELEEKGAAMIPDPYHTWIPSPKHYNKSDERYGEFYEKVGGILFLISSVYRVVDGQRHFEKIEVKLHQGGLPLLFPGEALTVPHHETEDGDLPVFFAKVVKE